MKQDECQMMKSLLHEQYGREGRKTLLANSLFFKRINRFCHIVFELDIKM